MEIIVSVLTIVSLISGGVKLYAEHKENKKNHIFEAAKALCENEHRCTELYKYTPNAQPEDGYQTYPKITPLSEIEEIK